MRPARLAKPAQQDIVIGFQKKHRSMELFLDGADDDGKFLKLVAFTNVHHQCGLFDL